MLILSYTTLHIPSGKKNTGAILVEADSVQAARAILLEKLDRGNAQAPGVWQYWSS